MAGKLVGGVACNGGLPGGGASWLKNGWCVGWERVGMPDPHSIEETEADCCNFLFLQSLTRD